MAISTTTEYLPQSVLTGDADVELLKPFIEWGKSITRKVNSTRDRIRQFGKSVRGLMIRAQAWWEYGEKNPATIAAGWIDEQLKISRWSVAGVNIGKWAQDDPIGFGASFGLLLTGGAICTIGAAVGAKVAATAVIGLGGGALAGLGSLFSAYGTQLLTMVGIGFVIRSFVSGIQRIWQFNWNISDQQIRQEQAQRLKTLASRYGEALGASVGTLCGFTLGRIAKANAPRLIRFNPNLLADLKELKARSWQDPGPLWEEAVEEISSAFSETANAAAAIVFLEMYMNARKLIKAASKFVQLQRIFPFLGKAIEKWGEPGAEPWTFAEAQEEIIESIDDETVRNFTEEFVESAQDMCAESTILVSYALG